VLVVVAEMPAEGYEGPPVALYVPAPVEERLVVVGLPLTHMGFALSSVFWHAGESCH